MAFGFYLANTILRFLRLSFSDDDSSGVQLSGEGSTTTIQPYSTQTADLDLDLRPQGAGQVKVSGSPVLTGASSVTPTASTIPIADGSGKLAAGWVQEVLALADLSDVTAKTGTGTVVVMDDSPTIITPVLSVPEIVDFTSATHNHQSTVNGGTLTSLAIQVSATDRLLGRSTAGAGAAEEIACTAAGRALLDDATVADQRTTLGLVIGTNVQAYDAELAALAGLTSAANKLPRFTGSGTADLIDVNATAAASTVPMSSGDGRLVEGWMRHFFMTGRLASWTHDPGGTTWSQYGSAATMTQVGTGTPTSGDTAVLPSETQTTGTTIGNSAGRISSATVTQRGWSPTIIQKVLTAASIANIRLWVCVTDTDLSGVATPTTQHMAGFEYDTSIHGTAFWRCITCDGVTANITVTTIAITNSTTWNLRYKMDDAGGKIDFYINDVFAASHTTNLPGQTTQLYHEECVTTHASAAKKINISSVHIHQN